MYDVEYTDTFGGEANYCWVHRATIPSADTYDTFTEGNYAAQARKRQALIMRRAKAAVGITGLRGRTVNRGDGYEFRPYGVCAVMFVTWAD